MLIMLVPNFAGHSVHDINKANSKVLFMNISGNRYENPTFNIGMGVERSEFKPGSASN